MAPENLPLFPRKFYDCGHYFDKNDLYCGAYNVSLSREFYTGWLTHWGEKIAKTDAEFTATELEKILSRNGSVVLYVC